MDKTKINNGGVLLTPYGNLHTVETRIGKTPVFKLKISGTFDLKSMKDSPLHQKRCTELERNISKLPGHSVEFLSMTGMYFNRMGEEFWSQWDGTNAGIHHDQIYGCMKRTIWDYGLCSEKALVVGCGTGEFLDYLAETGINARGIEINGQNVLEACRKFRAVECKRLQDLDAKDEFDLIIDPGVMSASVIPRDEVPKCLDNVATALRKDGIFIQIPYTRSLFTSAELTDRGMRIIKMTEPRNLFNYNYPKQVYVARKE